jgi:hypothetical protein
MEIVNFKKFKWFTLIGSLINVGMMIFFIVTLGKSISIMKSLSYPAREEFQRAGGLYIIYGVLTNISAISIVMSLLALSASLRDDITYKRYLWAHLTYSLTSIISPLTAVLLSNSEKYGDVIGGLSFSLISILVLFIPIGLAVVLPLIDIIFVNNRQKNNPFYNHKIRQEGNFYAVNNKADEEVVDDDLSQLSYFEIYEKRKSEIDALNQEYDSGKITLNEYNARRKEIYKKYDKYS